MADDLKCLMVGYADNQWRAGLVPVRSGARHHGGFAAGDACTFAGGVPALLLHESLLAIIIDHHTGETETVKNRAGPSDIEFSHDEILLILMTVPLIKVARVAKRMMPEYESLRDQPLVPAFLIEKLAKNLATYSPT